MVGNLPPPGLCSFSTERRRSADVKTTRELRIFATKLDQRGWMSENYPSLQRREKCFLLTSPFLEPAIDARCYHGSDKPQHETDQTHQDRAIATAQDVPGRVRGIDCVVSQN